MSRVVGLWAYRFTFESFEFWNGAQGNLGSFRVDVVDDDNDDYYCYCYCYCYWYWYWYC